MAVEWVEGQGAKMPGRPRRAAARAAVVEHLKARGMDDIDAEDTAEDAQVVRAWWGGPAVGFVNEDHPGAEAVTVLNIPMASPPPRNPGGGRPSRMVT